MAQGLTDESFKYHLINAKTNGITKDEIAENGSNEWLEAVDDETYNNLK